MKASLVISFVLFFICFSTINAQKSEFGEVTQEDLLQEVYSDDPDAVAAILYRNQNTYYNSNAAGVFLNTEIFERTKIYKKEGFDYSIQTINLYNGRSDKEKLRNLKAFTYNLVDGEIIKTELSEDQVFETELTYSFIQIKFAMPNIKVGSIIELRYEIISPFIWNIDEFRFQTSIPIKKIEAEIRTPKGYVFKQNIKGYITINSTKIIKRDHRIGNMMNITSFALENVPALKEENYVDNIANYRAGIQFELVSVEIPGTPFRSFAKSWEDVAKSIGGASDYKIELAKAKFFKDALDSLITDKSNQLKVAEKILDYVKDITEWNGVDGKYFQYGFKKTLKDKKGNTADINLLLVAMLRYAGFNANPVVISTKDNSIPFFPTLERLNYVIVHVEIDGSSIYMDATDEFSDINLLPIKDYNWGGVLVDNENMRWEKIYKITPPISKNIYDIEAKISEVGELLGHFRSRLTNHSAYNFRINFKNKIKETQVEEREKKFLNVEINEYEVENAETNKGNLNESFDFQYDNGIDLIGEKIFFSPLLFLKMDENPFKLEKREFPIDFGFPFQNRYMINIIFPEGYSVEFTPENKSIVLPDDLGKFNYLLAYEKNNIKLSVYFEINSAIIQAEKYLVLKNFFQEIITKSSEQIVLIKN